MEGQPVAIPIYGEPIDCFIQMLVIVIHLEVDGCATPAILGDARPGQCRDEQWGQDAVPVHPTDPTEIEAVRPQCSPEARDATDLIAGNRQELKFRIELARIQEELHGLTIGELRRRIPPVLIAIDSFMRACGLVEQVRPGRQRFDPYPERIQ